MCNPFERTERISLIYFRLYSDFCFAIGEDLQISVSENADGFTELHGTSNGITRKLVIFKQPAMEVFREVSPTDFILIPDQYIETIQSRPVILLIVSADKSQIVSQSLSTTLDKV